MVVRCHIPLSFLSNILFCRGCLDFLATGIVLWEALTRRLPHEGLTPIQAAFAVASRGLRPQIPLHAPPALAALARRCWTATPSSRPSFAQVIGIRKTEIQMKHKATGN